MDKKMDEYKLYLEDQKAHSLSGACDDKYLDYLVQTLHPDYDYSKAKILDVGCNKFLSYDYFLDKYNNPILGICISKDGLEEAWRNNRNALEMDAHNMNLHLIPNTYDLVISFHSFEHMYCLPTVLQNCNILLKDQGLLYFSLPIPSHNWHKKHWYDVPTIDAMNKLMEEAKFKSLHKEIIFCKIRPEQEMIGLYQKVSTL